MGLVLLSLPPAGLSAAGWPIDTISGNAPGSSVDSMQYNNMAGLACLAIGIACHRS
jgi:hypothetical protein